MTRLPTKRIPMKRIPAQRVPTEAATGRPDDAIATERSALNPVAKMPRRRMRMKQSRQVDTEQLPYMPRKRSRLVDAQQLLAAPRYQAHELLVFVIKFTLAHCKNKDGGN